jgi:hypothetical protein
VCVVGKSYPPEFYSFIKDSHLRALFEKIALETEEDYQNLINLLTKFKVNVIRPNTPLLQTDDLLSKNKRIPPPISMNPRDQMIMIGERFFFYPYRDITIKTAGREHNFNNWDSEIYDVIKGGDWPKEFTNYEDLEEWIQHECKTLHNIQYNSSYDSIAELTNKVALFQWWKPIFDAVKKESNTIIDNFNNTKLDGIPSNGITRIGKDLFFGTLYDNVSEAHEKRIADEFFNMYNCHFVHTGGHIDGCFSPVKPGLIMSIEDMKTYKDTFPDWEVIYLKGESWGKVNGFLELKKKNAGKWWIKGQEHNTDLINFIETWLHDWVGYVEESVFDVNILTIDESNVVVNGYNKKAFDAFERHGITPHICPMRHRYFWDGGIHCVTLDLDRKGVQKQFFK